MCATFLGFVLLAVLPGALHAQTQDCAPPVLHGGYFAPKQETYPNETTLSYSCDAGRKPVATSWWTTVTCKNGKWSHEPQCIDESACIPPIIPNGEYEETQNGWYEENHTIMVRCRDGYELKRRTDSTQCKYGRWSSLPVCDRRIDACDMPPEIVNGVIINQEAKEVFASGSTLEYKCKDGYETDREGTRNVITCNAAAWDENPSCSPFCVMRPADHEGYAKVNTDVSIKEGQEKSFQCVWPGYTFYVRCTNGRISAKCCNNYNPQSCSVVPR